MYITGNWHEGITGSVLGTASRPFPLALHGIHWFTGQNGIYGRLDPKSGAMQVWDAPRGRGPYGITTTPDGAVYPFARLHQHTELAGVCFSPDGSTLFVNAYSPAKTLAITGPWMGRG